MREIYDHTILIPFVNENIPHWTFVIYFLLCDLTVRGKYKI